MQLVRLAASPRRLKLGGAWGRILVGGCTRTARAAAAAAVAGVAVVATIAVAATAKTPAHMTAAVAPPPRLLCFHGKGDTGATFERRIERLKTLAEVTCVDAPHELGGGFAWWHLPPGERSFTTPAFEGWDATVAYVRRLWVERGPFDGILGFSQGAILLAGLAATGVLLPPGLGAAEDAAAGVGAAVLRPGLLMVFGAALPGPFRDQLSSIPSAPGRRALHGIGRLDSINPPEQARQVAEALGGEIWEHPGGHDVPMDDEALGVYEAFLRQGTAAAAQAAAEAA